MGKLETLRSELEKAKDRLHAKGYHYDGNVSDYHELMNAKPFEIAYQDVIEKLWPENAWWEITHYWDIFDAMMSGLSDEKVIDEICRHVGEDYLKDEGCEVIRNAHVEHGHKMREYLEKFGDDYDEGKLWDYLKEDFEDGRVDTRDDIVYWYMEDLNGDWRYFETNLVNESRLEEKKALKEGTSNFGAGPEHFPLLVFYTYDEFEYNIHNDFDYPTEDKFEDEDGNVDYDAFEQAQYDFEEKAWEENDVCVLDYDKQEELENKLDDFNEESKRMAWDADVKDGEQDYGPNLNLEDVKVHVEPGYYEAAYIEVEHEDYLDDLEDGFREQQIERFTKLFQELKEEFGLTQLNAGPMASNGERGYSIVKDESLKEGKVTKYYIENEKIGYSDGQYYSTEEEAWDVIQNKCDDDPESYGNARDYKVVACDVEESLKENKETITTKDGDEINLFDTKQEAHDYLEKYAKDNNIKYYDIVEDSYEVPNGLLFIEYEDEKQENEKSHYPLVAYKNKTSEDLKEDVDADELTRIEDAIRDICAPEISIKECTVHTGAREFKGIEIDIKDENSSSLPDNFEDKLVSLLGSNYWIMREDNTVYLVRKSDASYDDLYDDAASPILNKKEESLEEKKSKKKYKVRFTGDPAKDAAFFNHAMGSDKGEGGLEASSVSLGEGFIGQEVEDFLKVVNDPGSIETLVISNIDADDYTEAFNGNYDDLDSNLSHCEYADFDVGGDVLVVNVKEESDDWNDLYYDSLESLLDDYNGDEVRIVNVDTGETLFEGDKEEIDDEIKGLTFWSIDTPKYLCVNAHCGEDDDLDDEEDFEDDDLRIEYWYDEESRDQGLGDLYFGEIKDEEDGKRIVKKMIDRDGYASAELQRGDDVIFGYDGVDTWGDEKDESLDEASHRGMAYYEYKGCHVRETPSCFVATDEHGTTLGDSKTKAGAEALIDDHVAKKDEGLSKKEIDKNVKRNLKYLKWQNDREEKDEEEKEKKESMNESEDVYALYVKVINSDTGKIDKIERLYAGSKKECDAKKKQLEETSPEDSHHNKNVYKVSKVK